MKSLVFVLLTLTLIANSQCGLIDGFLGAVKQTTQPVSNGVSGVLQHSKNFVFGSQTYESGRVITKPGLIGRISLKIHDVSAEVRNVVRNVLYIFDGNDEKGFITRLLDRVKYRCFKIKSFLIGTGVENIEGVPQQSVKLNKDTKVLSDKLKIYVFDHNNAQKESDIRQTLISMREAINRIRDNISKHRKTLDNTNDDTQDGAGMIDVRQSVGSLDESVQDNFEMEVDTTYNKIADKIDEGRETTRELLHKIQENTKRFLENQKRQVRVQLNEINNN